MHSDRTVIGTFHCSTLEQFLENRRYAQSVPPTKKAKNLIGKRMAERRGKLVPPLTQDDLSGKLALVGIQLDRAAIAKIETNRRGVLDFELKAIAEALSVRVDWLLGVGN